jgi:hypothetical protein
MSFDSFTRIKFNDTQGYYVGTNYNKRYYYFNNTKTFLAPLKSFVNMSAIGLAMKDEILFYNHEGEFLWKTTSKDTYLIETTSKEKSRFTLATFVSNSKYGNYVIYDVEGKQIKQMSPNK